MIELLPPSGRRKAGLQTEDDMGGLSWWHWVIVLAVFILLFGAKKLPDAARGVGRSLRILKSEVSAMHEDEGARSSAHPSDAVAPSPMNHVGANSVPPELGDLPTKSPSSGLLNGR